MELREASAFGKNGRSLDFQFQPISDQRMTNGANFSFAKNRSEIAVHRR